MHESRPPFDAPSGGEGPGAREPGGTGGPGPSRAGAGHPREPGPGPGIERQCLELCPICRTADVMRAAMQPEFREHWHAWQREMLLAARSLLDHYIEHVESERRRAVQVEDIPIVE